MKRRPMEWTAGRHGHEQTPVGAVRWQQQQHCIPAATWTGNRGLAVSMLLLLSLWLPGSLAAPKEVSLKCYSDQKGVKFSYCDRGHKTCYTKFNNLGAVIGRGCSSRPGVYHTQCDSHIGGDHSEVFCYCSYNLCNPGTRPVPSLLLSLSLPLLLLLLLHHYVSSLASEPLMGRTL